MTDRLSRVTTAHRRAGSISIGHETLLITSDQPGK